VQELYWRLQYANGSIESEPIPDGASVLVAPKGAWSLTLVDSTGKPKIGNLDLQGQRPIFYRVRSMGLDARGARTDMIVFGYGSDTDNEVKCTLWATFDHGKIIPCPPELFDKTMLELQVTA
jgi:hypothetical protein